MTEKIEQAFEAMEWHDAALLSLNIDRRAPGECDEVVLLVEWPDGRNQKVRFTDCYALDAQMNFGVMAPESIRAARCIADAPKLAEMRQRCDGRRSGLILGISGASRSLPTRRPVRSASTESGSRSRTRRAQPAP